MKHPKKSLALFSLICLAFTAFTIMSDKEDRLLEIAKEYKTYRQYTEDNIIVTDSTKYSWTVALCERPAPIDSIYGFHYKKNDAFMSRANAEKSPHGNKLYRLYVKYYYAYAYHSDTEQPLGQVIVKETWNVQPVAHDSLSTTTQVLNDNDGKWYTPTTVSEVFIMYKENENETNDKGWNYGNVSIEDNNKKPLVLNDRKLSSCIGCHANTKYDRIFGIRNKDR